MTVAVGILGDGPAVSAIDDALGDVAGDAEVDAAVESSVDVVTVGTTVNALESGDHGALELVFAVGNVDDESFRRVNRVLADETRWFAVEIGGVGGHDVPDVAAAVTGFAPRTGCYECLRTRVAANGGGEETALESDAGDDLDPVADARLAGAIAGREGVRVLGGGESSAFGRVVEIPHARRTFLPVPGCRCGRASETTDESLRREYHRRDLEATLERAERAVDRRVGIVREVGEVDTWPAPYYLARLADTANFSDATVQTHAAGVDADWNRAFVKALGEALERYAAGAYREADFPLAPVADLSGSESAAGKASVAVGPSAFVTSSSFPGPDAGEDLRWVVGEDLATGTSVHLPLEFVVFPPPSVRHRPAITTGLGLGNSGVGAVLSGLYEVIERDAAMLAWYSTYEPLGLAVDDGGYETLARRAASEDLETTALLLTQNVDVPVVAVAVHREADWPRFATGLAADLDPHAAARGALAEALQNWMELCRMGPDDAADESGAIGHYADFPATVRDFVHTEMTVPAASVGPATVPEGADELDAVLDRVTGTGLSAYAARLTTRDVAALGFEVVRVLVPSAQPLFTDDAYFGERARLVPAELGFEPRLEFDHHPYP